MSNLIRNAWRYASDAGPIEVTAFSQNGQVRVCISDHGPGLPDAELDRVTAPFYRPEFARTRESGGVGLGLAIVKTCIDACQGTLRLRNRPTARPRSRNYLKNSLGDWQPSGARSTLTGNRRASGEEVAGRWARRFLRNTRKMGAVSGGHRKGCGVFLLQRWRASPPLALLSFTIPLQFSRLCHHALYVPLLYSNGREIQPCKLQTPSRRPKRTQAASLSLFAGCLYAAIFCTGCGGSASASSSTLTANNIYATAYEAVSWGSAAMVSFPSSCSMTLSTTGVPPFHADYYLAPISTQYPTAVAVTPVSGTQMSLVPYTPSSISSNRVTVNICPEKASSTTATNMGVIGYMISGRSPLQPL